MYILRAGISLQDLPMHRNKGANEWCSDVRRLLFPGDRTRVIVTSYYRDRGIGFRGAKTCELCWPAAGEKSIYHSSLLYTYRSRIWYKVKSKSPSVPILLVIILLYTYTTRMKYAKTHNVLYELGKDLNQTVFNKSTFLQHFTAIAVYNNSIGKAPAEKSVIF